MLSYASSDGEKNQSKGTRQEHNIAIQRHVREATQLWEETLLDLCVSSLRGAMPIFFVSFQFYRMISEGTPLDDKGDVVWGCDMTLRTLPAASKLHQKQWDHKSQKASNKSNNFICRPDSKSARCARCCFKIFAVYCVVYKMNCGFEIFEVSSFVLTAFEFFQQGLGVQKY